MSDVQADPATVDPAAVTDPAAVDPASADPKPDTDTSWVPKRIGEITAARRAAEKRAEELAAANAEKDAEIARLRAATTAPADGTTTTTKPASGMSQEDFDRLVQARAESLASQRTQTESMNSKIDAINKAGAKEFGAEFDKAVQNLQIAGVGGPDFLRVLTSVPNPEKIVAYLGKTENMNEAMRIGTMDPVQMGIEMAQMSEKAVKAFAKQVSKAPPPIETVSGRGNANSDGVEPDPSDHKAWIAWRAKTAKRKR